MTWFKVKIRTNDKNFSKYIRTRDKGLCQYNFKCFRGTEGTDCSHFQKRRKESVRFDTQNCDWVCRRCHFFVENDPSGQRTLEEWKEKQLGEREYKLLLLRANSFGKRDDKLSAMYIKELMKELE